jgi:hypothetical protein
MSSIKELHSVNDVHDDYDVTTWAQIEYCLHDFPTPFYVVEIPASPKISYNQRVTLLRWLNENDDHGGNYVADIANGFFYFKEYIDALNLYLTFGDVSFNSTGEL